MLDVNRFVERVTEHLLNQVSSIIEVVSNLREFSILNYLIPRFSHIIRINQKSSSYKMASIKHNETY